MSGFGTGEQCGKPICLTVLVPRCHYTARMPIIPTTATSRTPRAAKPMGTINTAASAGGFPMSGDASPCTMVSITRPSVSTTEMPRATPDENGGADHALHSLEIRRRASTRAEPADHTDDERRDEEESESSLSPQSYRRTPTTYVASGARMRIRMRMSRRVSESPAATPCSDRGSGWRTAYRIVSAIQIVRPTARMPSRSGAANGSGSCARLSAMISSLKG